MNQLDVNNLLRSFNTTLLGLQLQLNAQQQIASPGAGPVNNYAIGYTTSGVLIFQATDPGGTTITGIDTTPGTSTIFMLSNFGTGNLTLTHQDAGSLAVNRFALPGNVNRVLAPNEGVWIVYDALALRWKTIG